MKYFNFEFNRRQKIIIICVIITFGFLITTQTANLIYRRYFLIFILGVLAYFLGLWAFWEGIKQPNFSLNRLKSITILILPTLYVIALTSFYFLFREVRWLTRLPVGIFLGISYYLLLLAQNVFNVASIRTIPLYRAATSTNFIFTIATAVLLYAVIFTFNLPLYWNGVGVALASFPLFFQVLWNIKMEEIDSKTIIYSLILSLVVGECALALSFWPVAPFVRALLLAPIMYGLMGTVDEYLRERLTKDIIWEYLGVSSILFLIISFITAANY